MRAKDPKPAALPGASWVMDVLGEGMVELPGQLELLRDGKGNPGNAGSCVKWRGCNPSTLGIPGADVLAGRSRSGEMKCLLRKPRKIQCKVESQKTEGLKKKSPGEISAAWI